MLLAGGGTPAQESLVWVEALADATRVLYWPFAHPADRIPSASSRLREALHDRSIDVDVDTWEHLGGQHGDELRSYDLLFVGGGTTSKLVRHLSDHEFVEAVRDFLAAGGIYYGRSAGALLPCDEITLASYVEDDPRAAELHGLGLLRGSLSSAC